VRPGVIDVYEGNEVSERIFVSGGFAEVTAERCTVLADEAVPLSSLDAAAIEASQRALEGTLANLRDRVARLSGEERDLALIEQRSTELKLDVEADWDRALEAWRALPTDPGATYDRVVQIDASKLEPHVTWGTNPGMVAPVSGRVPDPQNARSDDDRKAVEQADSLVASAMKRLAEVFAEERSKLEQQWDRGDSVSTEDLRVALQRYRTFFHRLLSV